MIAKKDSVGYNIKNAAIEYVDVYMSTNNGPSVEVNSLCTVTQGKGFGESIKANAYPEAYLIEVLNDPASFYAATKNPIVDVTYDLKEYEGE